MTISKSKRTILKGLLLLSPTILALAILGEYWLSKGEQSNEAEREAPVRNSVTIEVKDGVTTLTVDQASQTHSGIQTAAIEEMAAADGPTVYGTVVDLQPLVELSSRYTSALADLSAAKTESATSRAELGRVRALYEDDQNVSQKAFGAASAADAAATAKLNVAQATTNAVAGSIRQQFGATVTSWVTSPRSPELAPFTARREVLIRIVLMSQSAPAPATLTLYGNGDAPIQARLVSESPQTDPNVQGRAYFYRTSTPLAVGARVIGHLGKAQDIGLDIPANAIVWYGGQPWAYARTTATTFERRAVDASIPRNGDYLVTRGFRAGEQVVVRGAQLLLSEESRALLSKD
ncbi:efflux RND transporter periplasmic adaptor subunit [Noviherbaspirillum pedocola]|uniref:Metal transporter n=1 Tax=Noviherbaspirillum pedocola TaxID=2801341 RepID=A0A934T2I3_9BURK|nr:metal transporter [Noviherbaspirillum pedocola]MBK4736778.1 metal transporter [Noviherbaspirillum pedocola]